MFKALAACPQATVVKPSMEKYAAVSRQISERLLALTPLVEPLSLDEAFLDLSGTERLHHRLPVETLARLQSDIERDIGITVSIGLSYCKFLAKTGSDLDKPRGFSVIGRAEAVTFLAPRPASSIWGVGKVFRGTTLAKDGINTIADIAALDEATLMKRYGAVGLRLHRLSQGVDDRRVDPLGERKSISSETTFDADISDIEQLRKILWRQAERVAERCKKSGFAGRTIALKLKTADFQIKTRHRKLSRPTVLADTLFRIGSDMLAPLADGTRYRLLGIGLEDIVSDIDADGLDLGDPRRARPAPGGTCDGPRARKFGRAAILKGRGL